MCVGNVVAMVDGRVRAAPAWWTPDRAVLEVRRSGEVRGRQGVSPWRQIWRCRVSPPTPIGGCGLAREIKPHWVAISFVCSAGDVQQVRAEVPPENQADRKD